MGHFPWQTVSHNQRVHCSHVSSTWESRWRSQHPNFVKRNWRTSGETWCTVIYWFNPWIRVCIYIYMICPCLTSYILGLFFDFFLFKLGQIPNVCCFMSTENLDQIAMDCWKLIRRLFAIFIISKFSVGFIIVFFIIILLFFLLLFFFFFFCFARWCALASCIPLGAFENDPRPWLTHSRKSTVHLCSGQGQKGITKIG